MKLNKLFIISLCILACSKEPVQYKEVNKKFSAEIDELKDYFNIPGVAVSIINDGDVIYEDYKGQADIENSIRLDSTHLFPIASLTKIFSGVLIMKLAEQKKLSLDESIKEYFPNLSLNDSIKIKHILSHTSQGEIGEKFYYSARFGALTRVIEKASGKTFEEFMKEEIFDFLNLKNTSLLKHSAEIQENNLLLAKPYMFNGVIEKGLVDYGASASAGIVSNLQDLQIFNKALETNALISERSKKLMFDGIDSELPYGYGIFSQQVNGIDVVWGYGQYDSYSSLFLKVPKNKLTLLLLANNNLMSDPARLIYGDVTSSLFALSFLKNYVFEMKDIQLLELKTTKNLETRKISEFYRKKLLAEALSESFLSRFDTLKIKSSENLLSHVFSVNPDYLSYADLSLLHNLTFLKSVAFYKGLNEFTRFDTEIEKIGEKLLKEDPQNPYVLAYMGAFYDQKGNIEKAKSYYNQITNAKNFSKNWYTLEALNWLKTH